MGRGGNVVRPLIAVTLADPTRSKDAAAARLKNELYLAAVDRAGGEPHGLDETAAPLVRSAAFSAMSGLLLTGGPDLDPALYGAAPDGSGEPDRDRDLLELEAWRAARDRGVPVLGICRGLQAINVFMGGRLVQHLDGHQGLRPGGGSPLMHPFRLVAGSRLATVLGHPAGATLEVNSFHHQAVTSELVAPGLIAVGFSGCHVGELVEALETADGRWVVGIQSHPERTDSTPPEFERLFGAFVEAAAAHG